MASQPFGQPLHGKVHAPSQPYGQPPHGQGRAPAQPFGQPSSSQVTAPSQPYGQPFSSQVTAPSQPYGQPFSNQVTAPSQPYGQPFSSQVTAPSQTFGQPIPRNVSAPSQPIGQPFPGNVTAQNGNGGVTWPVSHPFGHATVQQPTGFLSQHGEDEEDLPLLEELGIDVPAIWMRMQGIALFKRLDTEVVQNVDMSGPFIIVMALGVCLILRGKLHFGYIYGFGMVGFVGLYILINLMSQNNAIDLYSTISILGYGLLPVVLLAAVAILLSLTNIMGLILSVICILWCTATTSRFFETAVSLEEQRWLIAYPISLVYTCFVLITVF